MHRRVSRRSGCQARGNSNLCTSMEHPSSISPPSIRICDYNSSPCDDGSHSDNINNNNNHSNYSHSGTHSPSRPIFALSSSSSSSARTPMTIPGSNNEALAPPPLPPPRFIEDIAQGHDSGWKWGNSFEHDQFGQSATLPPIKPTSSLLGGAPSRPPLVRRDETYSFEEEGVRRPAMQSITSGSSLPDIRLQDGMQRSRDGPTSGSLGSGLPPLRLVLAPSIYGHCRAKSVENHHVNASFGDLPNVQVQTSLSRLGFVTLTCIFVSF